MARMRKGAGTSRFVMAAARLLGLLLGTTAAHAAADPALVADLRQAGGGAGSAPYGYSPRASAILGSYTYFPAETAAYGIELWRSDGTAAGTSLVADINSGRDDSGADYPTAFKGRLYFDANDGIHGNVIYESDGTPAGTHVLAALNGVSVYPGLTTDGNYLYFTRYESVYGGELWRWDGVSTGISLVADIAHGSASAYPARITPAGSKLYFVANDGYTGQEPWVSDGTPAGTALLRDIAPGANGSNIQWIAPADDLVYFNADDGGGAEVWVTDGTPAGTHLVADINPASGSAPALLGTIGDRLLFFADDGTHGKELWVSDGTGDGTTLVRDIMSGPDSGADFHVEGAVVDGRVWFPARDIPGNTELWVSDGTEAGTLKVAEINPHIGSTPRDLLGVDTRLYFSADDGVHGREPWMSDGSETALVADIRTGGDASLFTSSSDGRRRNFLPNPAGMLLVADDGIAGNELWRTDGTAAGTALVADIEPRAGAFPHGLVASPAGVYFIANGDAAGTQLWRSDGTAANTLPVSALASGDGPVGPTWMTTDAAGNLYYVTWDSTVFTTIQLELWRSDALTAQPRLVQQWQQPTYSLDAPGQRLASIGDTVYYYGWDAAHGEEPWRTDGTDDGTQLLADVQPGTGSSVDLAGDGFVTLGSTLLWSAFTSQYGGEPWISDGTAPGTQLLTDIAPQELSSGITQYVHAGGRLYFAESANAMCTVWQTDGTPASTRRAVDPLAPTQPCIDYAVVGDRIIYYAYGGAAGYEPWTSDGTVAGTVLLADIAPGGDSSVARQFTGAGDRGYFVASDAAHGRELWRTDGTPAGTALLRDIRPGPDSAAPYGLAVVGRTLVFGANDGMHGYELWMSNGTEIGTRLVYDIQDGAGSALPEEYTRSGNDLLFAADDGVHGVELWRLPVSDDDEDQVLDAVDSCLGRANATQLDSDGDGYGNACDADIAQPNDCVVNFQDLAVFKQAFFATPASANWNPDADFNGDGVVNTLDLAILKVAFLTHPGPSALSTTCGSLLGR